MALKIVKAFGTRGMSDDEDDANDIAFTPAQKRLHGRFQIIVVPWRAAIVDLFHDTLDNFALLETTNRGKPGPAPQERVRGHQVATYTPIRGAQRGLAVNAYNPQWLATLSPQDLIKVDVQDEVWDFEAAVNFPG